MAFCQGKACFLVEGSSLPEHMWGYPQPSCFSTGHFLPLTTTDDDTPHALIKSSLYLQRNVILFVCITAHLVVVPNTSRGSAHPAILVTAWWHVIHGHPLPRITGVSPKQQHDPS